MPASLARAYAWFLDLCGLLAGAIIAALAVLVTLDVVIRNLGVGTFPWLIEVAEYGLYVATFAAAPWVLRQGAHVRVDLLLVVVPECVARRLEVLVDAIGLGISLILLYYGLLAAADAFVLGSMMFKELVVAEWWLLAVLPASTALLAVEFVVRIRRTLAGGVRAAGPPAEGF